MDEEEDFRNDFSLRGKLDCQKLKNIELKTHCHEIKVKLLLNFIETIRRKEENAQ
jgi:hypothetical protein